MWRRLAALALVLPLAGCAPLVDEEQKATVQENLEALPAPALRALRAGEVKIQAAGPSAENAVGVRAVELRLGPKTPITLDAWVRGCRAAVAALAPTKVRLYGARPAQSERREPVDPDHRAGIAGLQEVDDARCQRGFGIRDRQNGVTSGGLRVGLLVSDGSVTDAAVDLDLEDRELTSLGIDWRPRGERLVPTGGPSEADGPVASLPLSLRAFEGSESSARWTIVVPAGQRLEIAAACARRDARSSMEFRPDDGNDLGFLPVPRDPAEPHAERTVSCTDELVRRMAPQLRYEHRGRLVDEYWVTAYASSMRDDEPATEIRIRALP